MTGRQSARTCLLAAAALSAPAAYAAQQPVSPPDPVAVARCELAARYAENEAGFFARDPDRVMRLRHPDFHTIAPDGNRSTREQMYERTRAFIGRIERFDSLSETIVGLSLAGDTAHAIVDQRTVRQQRFPDGVLHEIRTSAVQRESWIRTPQGWLMWRVDQVHPGGTLVDGRPSDWSPERRALESEIRALNDSMEAAFDRGDLIAVARFYSDSARMRGPGAPETRGRAAIDAYWTGIRNPVKWRLEVRDVGGSRDLPYQVGRSHLTSRGADGRERTYSTDFVVVWERQRDGSLRIVVDLWN